MDGVDLLRLRELASRRVRAAAALAHGRRRRSALRQQPPRPLPCPPKSEVRRRALPVAMRSRGGGGGCGRRGRTRVCGAAAAVAVGGRLGVAARQQPLRSTRTGDPHVIWGTDLPERRVHILFATPTLPKKVCPVQIPRRAAPRAAMLSGSGGGATAGELSPVQQQQQRRRRRRRRRRVRMGVRVDVGVGVRGRGSSQRGDAGRRSSRRGRIVVRASCSCTQLATENCPSPCRHLPCERRSRVHAER